MFFKTTSSLFEKRNERKRSLENENDPNARMDQGR